VRFFEGRKEQIAILGGIVLASVIAGTGCATGKKIELGYNAVPPKGLVRVADVGIYVAQFEDVRTDTETLGVISHGLFASAVRPDVKIRLREGSVPTWVRDALVKELELRGYDVLDAADGAAWQISGAVHELSYSEGGWMFMTRPRAMMTMECQLAHNQQAMSCELYSARAAVKGRDGQPGDPERLLETVLRRALKAFIEDLEAVRSGVVEKR
jgi:hypothetical protein